MITRDVEVKQIVRVTIDETKFTPEFMEEFRRFFFPYDTIDDHLEHIAQLVARGVVDFDWRGDSFIEGYGHAKEKGISATVVGQEQEVLTEQTS